MFLDVFTATERDDGIIESKVQVKHERVEIGRDGKENFDIDFHYPFNESTGIHKCDITDNQ